MSLRVLHVHRSRIAVVLSCKHGVRSVRSVNTKTSLTGPRVVAGWRRETFFFLLFDSAIKFSIFRPISLAVSLSAAILHVF